MEQPDSQSKTLLVTGATGCLGKALCLEAAKQGSTLILHGRTQAALTALDDEIQAAHPTTTILWPLDFLALSDENISQTLEELKEIVGSIDLIFNCAAKLGQQTPILQERQKLWDEVLQVNVTAPRLLLKHCLPLLLHAPAGRVVFFRAPSIKEKIYEGAFGASKTMIEHLSTQVNLEFENVNPVRSVIIEVAPLFSALRAKTHPGEDPRSNANATDEAKRIIQKLYETESF